jgi:hypothetical protein
MMHGQRNIKLCLGVSSVDEGGRVGGGRNYRGLALRKGTQGRTMFHMFLSFSVVSFFVLCPRRGHTEENRDSWYYLPIQ